MIGSGATAVTLVPAMAERRRARDDAPALAELRRLAAGARPDRRPRCAACCPPRLAYPIVRWKNVLLTTVFYQLSRRAPAARSRRLIRKGVERGCRAGYDVDTHFTPRYDPWDQRICLVPDGDLFEAIRAAARRRSSPTASRPSPRTGCGSTSGAELEADIDRHRDRPEPAAARRRWSSPSTARRSTSSETVGYKGMMFSGVPNLALALGYTNASWTLKADLVARVRLPAAQPHGRARLPPVHAARARPVGSPTSRSSTSSPATCCARSTRFPSRARPHPWRLHQNYPRDILLLRHGPLEDEGIEFSGAAAPQRRETEIAA